MPLLQTKGDRDVRAFKVTSSGAILQGLMDPEMRDIAAGKGKSKDTSSVFALAYRMMYMCSPRLRENDHVSNITH